MTTIQCVDPVVFKEATEPINWAQAKTLFPKLYRPMETKRSKCSALGISYLTEKLMMLNRTVGACTYYELWEWQAKIRCWVPSDQLI
jgi:hypothetical protein